MFPIEIIVSALPLLFTPAPPLRDTSATFVQSGARLISAPFWRRNLATYGFRFEQAPSSAVLPPAIVLGETPFAIRAFASGNLPSAAANIRKLAPVTSGARKPDRRDHPHIVWQVYESRENEKSHDRHPVPFGSWKPSQPSATTHRHDTCQSDVRQTKREQHRQEQKNIGVLQCEADHLFPVAPRHHRLFIHESEPKSGCSGKSSDDQNVNPAGRCVVFGHSSWSEQIGNCT